MIRTMLLAALTFCLLETSAPAEPIASVRLTVAQKRTPGASRRRRRPPVQGTGTVISKDGLLITCAHFFGRNTDYENFKATVETFDFNPEAQHSDVIEDKIDARILLVDARNDLALMQIPAAKVPAFRPVAPIDRQVQKGDAIHVWWCRQGIDPAYAQSTVLNNGRFRIMMPATRFAFEFYQGASGSGIFNEQNELIGVVQQAPPGGLVSPRILSGASLTPIHAFLAESTDTGPAADPPSDEPRKTPVKKAPEATPTEPDAKPRRAAPAWKFQRLNDRREQRTQEKRTIGSPLSLFGF